jgi:hypothetical protein
MRFVMLNRLLNFAAAARKQLDAAFGENWVETLVHMTFGVFLGGLGLLLILIVCGVPVVGLY